MLIQNLQLYFHEVVKWLFIGFCFWKMAEIKEFVYSMLGENGKVSSRRTCAFLCVFTICYMSTYGLHNQKPIDHWILGLLAIFAILCLGLATLPQIMQLLNNAKGIMQIQAPLVNNDGNNSSVIDKPQNQQLQPAS